MTRKYIKRLRFAEGMKMEHWGTLRVVESKRSGLSARILTIRDQPLTGYLPIAEAHFILDAINDKLMGHVQLTELPPLDEMLEAEAERNKPATNP